MTKTKKIIMLFTMVLALIIVATIWYISGIYTNCRMTAEAFEEIVSFKPDHSLDSGILYADEENAVFSCLDGIFVYNYNEDKVERMIDVRRLNCAINEGKPDMGTVIHSNGEKIALINWGDETSKFDNYLVYIKTGFAKKENEPRLGKGSGPGWASWIAELDCWRSSSFMYVGEEMFYMELNKGDKLERIKLVVADKNTNARREFYPFSEK